MMGDLGGAADVFRLGTKGAMVLEWNGGEGGIEFGANCKPFMMVGTTEE